TVQQDVQTTERVHCRFDRGDPLLFVRDVQTDVERVLAERLHDRLPPPLVDIGDRHPGTLAREKPGGSLAQPRRTARDERDLASDAPALLALPCQIAQSLSV